MSTLGPRSRSKTKSISILAQSGPYVFKLPEEDFSESKRLNTMYTREEGHACRLEHKRVSTVYFKDEQQRSISSKKTRHNDFNDFGIRRADFNQQPSKSRERQSYKLLATERKTSAEARSYKKTVAVTAKKSPSRLSQNKSLSKPKQLERNEYHRSQINISQEKQRIETGTKSFDPYPGGGSIMVSVDELQALVGLYQSLSASNEELERELGFLRVLGGHSTSGILKAVQ